MCDELLEACKRLSYLHPTKIQRDSLPYSLKGSDIIGLAETGSGKTAAFTIPILQSLLGHTQTFHSCILAPTRELCLQINEHILGLGAEIGIKTSVILGGLDRMEQAVSLARKPHIIIGTPGRLADHLANTKGFSLSKLKFLVLDEADKLLNMDFEKQITQILSVIPKHRTTFLFSATMTSKVKKLQRACLNNAVKLEVNSKYSTVSSLVQNYLFIPAKYKDTYLVYLLNKFPGSRIIIFVGTILNSMRVHLMLLNLSFNCSLLTGNLSQTKRIHALNSFKSGEKQILIATDVANRGLDLPNVDMVLNYDLPGQIKNYIHRVGRTARAGKSGLSFTLVTQYDVEIFQKIEFLIGKRLEEYPTSEELVLLFYDRVLEANRLANSQIKTEEKQGMEGMEGVPDPQSLSSTLFNFRGKRKLMEGRKQGGTKNRNYQGGKSFARRKFKK